MKKKRIVVKIGSSSLTNSKGEIDQEKFNDHVEALAALREAGTRSSLSFIRRCGSWIFKLGIPN